MAKKKKKKKGGKIFIVIFIACIAIAAFAGYQLISIGLTYKEAEDEYADLQQYAVIVGDGDDDTDNGSTDSESTDEVSGGSASANKIESSPVIVDFDALEAINPDVIGWLYIPVEDISYPIMQSDDNDYYLHRTTERTSNYAGSIFMDYQNSSDFTDPNTIIYGHNMKDQSMFGKLKFVLEYEDYVLDDTFWITTRAGAYKYQMISLQFTLADSDVYTLFSGPSDLVADYIATQSARSSAALELPSYDANSRVVTLSTCATSNDDGRFVILGLLVGTAEV